MGRAAPALAALLLGAVVLAALLLGVSGVDPGTGPRVGVPSASRGSPPPTLGATTAGEVVLVGAGDIGRCDSEHDEATARLVERIGGTVFTVGDNAYERGTEDEFERCYGPSWGRFRHRTRPTPGNHDYGSRDAEPYFAYFGPAAGSVGEGWYAYDLGPWRVYALNSNCGQIGGCGPGSPQLAWLERDLRANPRRCIAAYWHHPRFTTGRRGNDEAMASVWRVLHGAGAELVVAGHEHVYERFAPRGPDGEPDPERGIRQFVVGTGGASPHGFGRAHPTLEVRESGTFGVLELRLEADGYRWQFHPTEGGSFKDSGSGRCH